MGWKAREFHWFDDLISKRREVDCGSSRGDAQKACERLARETGRDAELVSPGGNVNEWCTPDGTWRDHGTSDGDEISEGFGG